MIQSRLGCTQAGLFLQFAKRFPEVWIDLFVLPALNSSLDPHRIGDSSGFEMDSMIMVDRQDWQILPTLLQ